MTARTEETRNRGKHPSDEKLFSAKWHPALKEAVDDLEFLLERGYGSASALQLVGNRYRLNKRQQEAVLRMSASAQEAELRRLKACSPAALAGATVAIDGFNQLILLESILSGAYVFGCRDGTIRDISSVHGSYKRVVKTEDAARTIGEALQELRVAQVAWWLDAPISNSGRLKSFLRDIGQAYGYPWELELANNPDLVLAESDDIVITSDGWILDRADRWFNFGAYLVERQKVHPQLIRV
ncbi:DUF434 domain-containing protein [Catalinimonas alkaloidigena]|nr:DUF434 domain-containing protein [Catalinimonas alkaloidigena]